MRVKGYTRPLHPSDQSKFEEQISKDGTLLKGRYSTPIEAEKGMRRKDTRALRVANESFDLKTAIQNLAVSDLLR